MSKVKVLLVQLASNGDCLFVTAIAKQIKERDYPGCQLTWMVGSRYRQVIDNNPYIDEVIEIPINSLHEVQDKREAILDFIDFKAYHKVYITDYFKGNVNKWYGTTRSSLFRSYPNKIIDPSPQMFLRKDEIVKVQDFCRAHQITPASYNILFECSPQSGQSKLNLDTALLISKKLCELSFDIKIILSSNRTFQNNNKRIIDGSLISWRENFELVKHCHLLVGCSSGISWLSTSSGLKKIDMIQILDPNYFNRRISASLVSDFKFFNIDSDNIIELNNPTEEYMINTILLAKKFGVRSIVGKGDQRINVMELFSNIKIIYESRITFLSKLFWTFRLICAKYMNFGRQILRLFRKMVDYTF